MRNLAVTIQMTLLLGLITSPITQLVLQKRVLRPVHPTRPSSVA